MKSRISFPLLGALAAFAAFAGFNASGQTAIPDDPTIPEIHITRDGKATLSGVKIMQRINTTFLARTEWEDETFIRWSIKTGAHTDIRKRFGGSITASEIKEGDYLYVEGSVESGSALSINATKIIDWSDHTAQGTASGTVREIVTPSKHLTLLQKDYQTIDVFLTATTTVLRNRYPITASLLKAGDTVSSIEGIYDSKTKTMQASKIIVSVDPTIFVPKNFQGTLQSLPQGNPASFTLAIDSKSYKIQLTGDALILNKARQTVTFTRWLVGDTVRIYGNIREDNDALDTISASVARNINF